MRLVATAGQEGKRRVQQGAPETSTPSIRCRWGSHPSCPTLGSQPSAFAPLLKQYELIAAPALSLHALNRLVQGREPAPPNPPRFLNPRPRPLARAYTYLVTNPPRRALVGGKL